ncbi:MAG: hypothetical protein AB1330_03910 [Bacillota bacterium]
MVAFFKTLRNREALATPAAIYYAVATLALLKRLTPEWRPLGERLRSLQEPAGGFWVPKHLWVEATSRLENTFYAVGALTRLGISFEAERCARFVTQELLAALETDELASLPTVYYAVEVLSALKQPLPQQALPLAHLEKLCRQEVGFLEHWYYLVAALKHLGRIPFLPEKIVAFVLECERTGGGFARSTSSCAIPTILNTFYATKILQSLGVLPDRRENQ